MLELQQRGAHNINLVTATHFVPQFLLALDQATGQGLGIPIVFNDSGYETVETLRLLEDVVDIYLPDAKYADDAVAIELSSFVEYVSVNRAALLEIYRQVGDVLMLDEGGIARRGMIIRHMVLPERLAGSAEVFQWIAAHLSPAVHVSVMNQYFPAHRALEHPILKRKITEGEYDAAVEAFLDAGLEHGWYQECELDEGGPDDLSGS
jgi:putative pyruvate formate lyase activating enzyme